MFYNWQVYFSEVIRGQKKGPLSTLLLGILHVLSWGFQGIAACRNWAFDHRFLTVYSPPVPLVISVGNIVAGGTGKTPVTLMIAQEFCPEIPLAILSRGYKSGAEKLSAPVFLSHGKGPEHSSAYCGDEPYLLSKNLPEAIVIVGRDRQTASNMAYQAGAQVILLDDGMQHRRLNRDSEVVVLNALDLFGQGYFLPRGFLRESLSGLSRADLIIVNHVGDHEHFDKILKELEPYSKAPAMGTRMEVDKILDCSENRIASIEGKKVGIFCGIANPAHFQGTVKQLGADIVSHLFTSDHAEIDLEQLIAFAEESKAAGAELLVCTEKDYVKLLAIDKFPLPILWLQMKLAIVAGQENWNAFITKAKADIDRRTYAKFGVL